MSASIYSINGSTTRDASLYEAAVEGKFELLEKYGQPFENLLVGENNDTILHLHLNSPRERSKDYVQKVLSQCPHLLWQINNNGDIPLHIAAKYGHYEIVKSLIEEAEKPIHRDLEVEEEKGAVRRMLRLRNKQNETALHVAVTRQANSLSVVREILEHEYPCYNYTTNKCGESPLYLAVSKRLYSTAIAILNKFQSPDCSGPKGTTILHAAAMIPHRFPSGFIRSIVEIPGLAINQADEIGWTALHYAAYFDDQDLATAILNKDTQSAYATDKWRNRTPLHIAACAGNVGIMNYMIWNFPQCGEITDARGWNVLHYAVVSKCEEAVKTITGYSPLVDLINGKDIKGYTPLHLLVASGNSSLLSWLRSNVSSLNLDIGTESIISRFPKTLVSLLDKHKDENVLLKEILEWTEDLGEDPFGIKIAETIHREEKGNRFEEITLIPELEKGKDSHLVVATLVSTVTFAAAFTLPGGYISDENDPKLKGTPILSRNTAFKAFVIADGIAMVLSTSTVFIHFVMVMLGYKQRYYWLIRSTFSFMVVAIGAMVVAFVTGTYAVLAPNSKVLAVVTCVIGLSFFVLVLYAYVQVVSGFIKQHFAPVYLSCLRYWQYGYNRARRWCP